MLGLRLRPRRYQSDALTSRLDLIHSRLDLIHNLARSNPHHSASSHPQLGHTHPLQYFLPKRTVTMAKVAFPFSPPSGPGVTGLPMLIHLGPRPTSSHTTILVGPRTTRTETISRARCPSWAPITSPLFLTRDFDNLSIDSLSFSLSIPTWFSFYHYETTWTKDSTTFLTEFHRSILLSSSWNPPQGRKKRGSRASPADGRSPGSMAAGSYIVRTEVCGGLIASDPRVLGTWTAWRDPHCGLKHELLVETMDFGNLAHEVVLFLTQSHMLTQESLQWQIVLLLLSFITVWILLRNILLFKTIRFIKS